MHARFRTTAALALLVAVGCRRANDDAPKPAAVDTSPARTPSAPSAPTGTASPTHEREPAPAPPSSPAIASTKLLPDEEVGPLLARLSENPGSFPSENYVTNETSLLHVARAIQDPKLRGRAYVGVGPEQNYTYLAMLEPSVAYIVDIRRGNLLEHMFFRACFEAAATRLELLGALLMRRPRAAAGTTATSSIVALEDAFRGVPADPELRTEGIARTKAVLDRLHVTHTPADDKAIARIHEAFSAHALAIKYTMLGSQRLYPSLGDNFAATEPESNAASFLASEESYARARRLVLENRVLPVVGDFGGTHALRAVADDMRARGLELGVFYTSNVEQYLFESRTYGNFVASVDAMPRDDESRLVRVWFDAGKPHPAQRAGHRTTQLAIPANVFLARATTTPFRYYWDVVNQPATP
jgi:hypothetical protein